jgi:hypothetical protein
MSTLPFYMRRERHQTRLAAGATFGVLVATGAYMGLWGLQLAPLVAMGGWAPASALALLLAARARRRSLQATLAVGITLGGAAGVVLYAISPPPAAAIRPAAAQRAVELQALKLEQELAIYAQRPRDPSEPAYPGNAGFATFVDGLKTTRALPPVSSGVRRPLRGAKELANGAPPTPVGTRTAQKPGSLVYDHDDASDTYVLYAIGQHGELVGQAHSSH